jgi:hypothetical protein
MDPEFSASSASERGIPSTGTVHHAAISLIFSFDHNQVEFKVEGHLLVRSALMASFEHHILGILGLMFSALTLTLGDFTERGTCIPIDCDLITQTRLRGFWRTHTLLTSTTVLPRLYRTHSSKHDGIVAWVVVLCLLCHGCSPWLRHAL